MIAQTIYLIRHAQVDGNVYDLDQRISIRDFNLRVTQKLPHEPLNEQGVQQAKALAPRVARFNLACLYASSLLRAQQTARILAEAANVPIITRDDLHEILPAPLDGPAHREYTLRGAYFRSGLRLAKPWTRDIETFLQAFRRVRRAWHEMTTETRADFGIVGHQGLFRLLLFSLRGGRQWRVLKGDTSNAGISIVVRRT
jgi:broad specificity phosphatase PhoE